ncbi:hypothetical protein [Flavobacterium sp. UMI-01]|uniref:hypothetical protein n=1 Tax=Flavobacterium sp. UMI-01 TaxID=1441053 RepID=UPI001C7CFC76|nr:hypothetical protein [Flavobacterium sp. UMI-01]GIZ09322.1 hypothetical protein FUMI01_20490 [Flavobacterium sp. UMI-01]
MNSFDPQRTFIHEIGHFIARELNKDVFKIGLGVDEIYITGNENFFTSKNGAGGTKPKKPKDFIENNIVYNPDELVAVLLYGCLFQSIYYKTKFNDCFTIQNYASGKKDAEHFSSLEKYISGQKRKRIVEYLDDEYINVLNSCPEHFELINKLHYEDFILCIRDGDYIIDIEKLRNELKPFSEEHASYYKQLIDRIKIINSS